MRTFVGLRSSQSVYEGIRQSSLAASVVRVTFAAFARNTKFRVKSAKFREGRKENAKGTGSGVPEAGWHPGERVLRIVPEQPVTAPRIYHRDRVDMELKAGIVCDRGLNPRRRVNEDRYLALPDRGLYAVFDGVGGQRAGDVASQTASDTIEESLAHDSASSPAALIRRAIQFANRDILEMAAANPHLKTMATTVALIHVLDGNATVAHVGDSRVYRFENGRLYRETIDHTDLNDDIRAGRLSKERSADYPEKNIINRALGVESDIDVEMKSVAVRDGARFLVCSDGIYRHMTDEELARVLAEFKDPQRAADELKRIVHQRGADDNLTAIVVQVGRARQSAVLGTDDGLAGPLAASANAAASGYSANSVGAAGRFQVDVRRERRERESRYEPRADFEPVTLSPSRTIIKGLAVAVMIAGAFYLGLRASEWFKQQSSNGSAASEPLRRGVGAFDRSEFQAAMVEFDAAVKLEPSNALAHYWLGRSRLEQHDYQQASLSFEQAVVLRPSLYDAYVQAAAAYELMGERGKALAMLARGAEERKKQQR